MMKINLLGKPTDPLVSKPDKEKGKKYWKESKSKSIKKRTITYCSCGKHPVNPKKDVYKQHNHWLRQQLDGPVETEHSQLQDATPIGASVKKFVPTYDFSGEDFEMSPDELRKIRNEQGK